MADENKNPYSLREIFQRMELDLISALKRTFFRHKEEQIKEGFEWEQWQLSKLRNIEKYRKENQKIIGEYSAPIQKTIDDVLEESFNAGENRVEKAAEKAKKEYPEIDLPKDLKPINTDKKLLKLVWSLYLIYCQKLYPKKHLRIIHLRRRIISLA
ncbi:phage minor capsid protein 2 [Clostridium pasteurianum DSM 525 = ATCC 6013]|uniref:Minor capsid 2 protein n=1 Tax=Clostridium pasteurianum DSM 525 = ATCC 6013 TaxID=1262449 RepID=A0A0H3JBP1_CLOPA|nr:phage minor capsid protein [Clostridium pasteurianum]AJA50070.1 phage minor capsid protein 2 [Clostridium pasteurianum DSM 525 = ATCC 6013]AJA54058.1 phage minor capsid protein 2 [Clostridium pasteurianum DSM 525 = ATCC 6013]KRU13917.1 minor capsid 2 protein [Clostridium pasteurianum DSM 525 = ATCC 6013]OMH21338.1 hypothetical protein AC231_12465 [Clostridium pasteurianum]